MSLFALDLARKSADDLDAGMTSEVVDGKSAFLTAAAERKERRGEERREESPEGGRGVGRVESFLLSTNLVLVLNIQFSTG